MKIDEILLKLNSKKSIDRRRSAKEIGKLRNFELAEELYKAYLNEKNDKRTWETQVEMILSLGILNYKKSINDIESIVIVNNPYDMITNAAAQTFVRLKRESLSDASPIIELLRIGGLSVVDGCLNPLGYDRMIPNDIQINEIINLCWDLHKHKDRIGLEFGFSDPRYGLVAGCAGWNVSLTKSFLEHCISTGDTTLKYVAENSLKGKYVKLR